MTKVIKKISLSLDPACLDSLNQDKVNDKTVSNTRASQRMYQAQNQQNPLQDTSTPPVNSNQRPNMVSVSPEHPPIDIGHHENVTIVEVGQEMQMDLHVGE